MREKKDKNTGLSIIIVFFIVVIIFTMVRNLNLLTLKPSEDRNPSTQGSTAHRVECIECGAIFNSGSPALQEHIKEHMDNGESGGYRELP